MTWLRADEIPSDREGPPERSIVLLYVSRPTLAQALDAAASDADANAGEGNVGDPVHHCAGATAPGPSSSWSPSSSPSSCSSPCDKRPKDAAETDTLQAARCARRATSRCGFLRISSWRM